MTEKQKIGLGTAAIGRPQYINIKKGTPKKFDREKFRQHGLNVLDLAYENGVRYFDTSPGYGMAEDVLIDWLKTKKDDSIELATKWGYSYIANFDPNAKIHELKEHSISQLLKQWKVSNELLPSLTTYQIHSATFDTGVLENKDVLYKLEELQQEHGMHMGLSTSGSNQVEVLKRAMDVEVNGKQLFDAFQVTYNMLDQSLLEISNDMVNSGKRIIIKEALANGRLFRNEKYKEYTGLYNQLEKLSAKYEVGVDAIALDFCTQTIDPFIVLSGVSEESQLLENLKSNKIELSLNDVELLKLFGVAPNVYWDERKKLSWN